MDPKLPTLDDYLEEYGTMLWNYCLAETSHRQDAEDLMQMVLLRLRRSIERAEKEPITSPRALVLSMLRYAILDFRRKAIRSRILEQIIAEELLGQGGVLDLVAEYHSQLNLRVSSEFEAARALIAKLRKGRNVAGLSERQHQVVWGCILQERTQEDVANELGIARGTVAITLARAKTKLQAWLEEKIRNLNDEDDSRDDEGGDDWFFNHGDGDLPLSPTDPFQSGPQGLALPEDSSESGALSAAEEALYADLAEKDRPDQTDQSSFLDELLHFWLPFETLALQHSPSLRLAPRQADRVLRLVFEHALEDWRDEIPASKENWIVASLREARVLIWIREKGSNLSNPEPAHLGSSCARFSGGPRVSVFVSYCRADRELKRIRQLVEDISNQFARIKWREERILESKRVRWYTRTVSPDSGSYARILDQSSYACMSRLRRLSRESIRHVQEPILPVYPSLFFPLTSHHHFLERNRIVIEHPQFWDESRRSLNRCCFLILIVSRQSIPGYIDSSELSACSPFPIIWNVVSPIESENLDWVLPKAIPQSESLTLHPNPQNPTPRLNGLSPSIRVTAHEPGYWFTHPERDHAMNRKQCLELSLKYLQARADRFEIEQLEDGVTECPEIAEWFRFTCRHFYAQEMINSCGKDQPHALPSLWPEGLEFDSTEPDLMLPENSDEPFDDDF
tara:strand:- start:847 stop:2892 length:2046 start_codon:yes stop_codon:yes gene_type:complete